MRQSPRRAAARTILLALSVSGCSAPPATATGAPALVAPASPEMVAPAPPPRDAPSDPSAVPSADAPTHPARGVPIQRGGATYYADRFAGRPTASGEPYDPRALTAAHRTLPFGAVVDVVRGDGRRVRVRINDRGPFAKGKIIDLSRRAAEQIGLVSDGIAPVTLELIWRPRRKTR